MKSIVQHIFRISIIPVCLLSVQSKPCFPYLISFSHFITSVTRFSFFSLPNALKNLSIVPFTPLLVPYTPLLYTLLPKNAIKTLLSFTSSPSSPFITSVTRFSLFSLPNALKNLSIVPFTKIYGKFKLCCRQDNNNFQTTLVNGL